MASATINHLPDEMLEVIFMNLCGKDVLNASRVCCRWQSIVAGFSEKFWERLCSKEYANVYKDSYRVSGLNWRELYNSFSLWENVADAEVAVSLEPVVNLQDKLHLLKNGVISFPIACNRQCIPQKYDTVIYYNVKTRCEINRITYDVAFSNYEENDNIIVFEFEEGAVGKIRIITKVKERKVTHHQIVMKYRPWLLIGNEIFYMIEKETNREEVFMFCRLRVIIDNEDVHYENSDLAECGWDDMLDVKYVDNKMYVFQKYEGNGSMSIAEIINNDMNRVCDVEDLDHTAVDVLDVLRQYGFSWSNPNIFLWMIYRFDEESRFNVDSKVITAPLSYGPHLLTGIAQPKSEPGSVRIYLNAFDADSRFIHHTLKALQTTLSINIDDSLPEKLTRHSTWLDGYYLEHLKVIETINGHMLLLIYCQRLIIIDITHKGNLGSTLKRSVSCIEASTKKPRTA